MTNKTTGETAMEENKKRLMRPLPEWKQIVRRAWSIRLMILAGILSGAETILPLFMYDMPRGLFSVLALIVTTLALVARLVAQEGLSK